MNIYYATIIVLFWIMQNGLEWHRFLEGGKGNFDPGLLEQGWENASPHVVFFRSLSFEMLNPNCLIVFVSTYNWGCHRWPFSWENKQTLAPQSYSKRLPWVTTVVTVLPLHCSFLAIAFSHAFLHTAGLLCCM